MDSYRRFFRYDPRIKIPTRVLITQGREYFFMIDQTLSESLLIFGCRKPDFNLFEIAFTQIQTPPL